MYIPESGEKGLHEVLHQCHVDRPRLEERVTYWRAMLAHVQLLSGEALSREREGLMSFITM